MVDYRHPRQAQAMSESQPPVPQALRAAVRASVAVAVAILLLRIIAWFLTRSAAVLADAIEPFFNLVAAGVTAIGVQYGRRPADEDHPYGHRKLEFVVVLIHGALVCGGALVVAYAGLWQYGSGLPIKPTPLAVVLFTATIVITALLGQMLAKCGQEHDSPALLAAGRHARLDVLVALGVLANLLIVGQSGWRWVDPLFTVLLVIAIVFGAVRLILKAAAGLMDTAHPRVRAAVQDVLQSSQDDRVVGYHDIRCRDSGGLIFVDFHLQFADGTSLEAAHDRAEAVEAAVEAAVGLSDATAHLEPDSAVRADREHQRGPLTDRERGRRRAAATSLLVAVLLGAVKFTAFGLTGSTAILSDALESLVNILAAGFAVYSVRLSRSGTDDEHPYGHYKVEFLAAALEGLLIVTAATAILITAVPRLFKPELSEHLGAGLGLLLLAGLANALLGWHLVRTGRRLASLTLEADGRHVLADVWTSLGVIGGLVVVAITKVPRLDPLIALCVTGYLVYTGLHLTRRALSGVIDTVDPETVDRAAKVLDSAAARGDVVGWHKLRVRDAGAIRFIEAHIQLADGCSLSDAHDTSERLEARLEEVLAPANAMIHAEPALEAR